jgi:beta-glucosidase
MASNPDKRLGDVPSSAPYKDRNLPVDKRVEDLLSRMALAEKTGQIFHTMIMPGKDGELSQPNPVFGLPDTEEMVGKMMMTHFNLLGPIESAATTAQ